MFCDCIWKQLSGYVYYLYYLYYKGFPQERITLDTELKERYGDL